MVMLTGLDRYHLVMDVIDRVPGFGAHTGVLRPEMQDAQGIGAGHSNASQTGGDNE